MTVTIYKLYYISNISKEYRFDSNKVMIRHKQKGNSVNIFQ